MSGWTASARRRFFASSAAVATALVSLGTAPGTGDAAPGSSASPRGGTARAVRIAVRPRRVEAGRSIRFRLENRGDAGVGFGEEFSIQVRHRDGWARSDFSPTGPWYEILLGLGPDRLGTWDRVRIPRDTDPGVYRVVKPLTVARRKGFRTAEFRVTGWRADKMSGGLSGDGPATPGANGRTAAAASDSSKLIRSVPVPAWADREAMESAAEEQVRLRVSPEDVAAGGTVRFRIEDRSSTAGVGYGLSYAVQVLVDQRWVLSPLTPEGPWPAVLAQIAAGKDGAWETLPIPPSTTPGRYRIKRKVSVAGRRRFLASEFQIDADDG
jgi:hypothetical protein